MTNATILDGKRKAMEAIVSEAQREAERVRAEYPGWVGEAMAHRTIMWARDMVRMIAAYTPPGPDATIYQAESLRTGK